MNEIKFCENNFSHGTDEIMSKLKEELEDVNVSADACLGYCGDCAIGPFALVNDELIQADTADELYEAIKDAIA
jgi:uncharacterized protein YuzB (UPF0349 family)